MITQHKRHNRGAAMLIVLASLIFVVTTSVSLAKLVSITVTHNLLQERKQLADDLLQASEAPILNWLREQSGDVVLPPESRIPGLTILHDRWLNGRDEIILDIQAFDQCGMVPIETARSGSPLRLSLPDNVADALDQVDIYSHQHSGLDLLAAAVAETGLGVFPELIDKFSIVDFFAEQSTTRTIETREDKRIHDQHMAIGAYVATHNPGLINVNTAPIELLETTMRYASVDALEQVVSDRKESRLASAPNAHRQPEYSSNLPRLVSSSPVWSFRINIKVGPLRRSWWSVYKQSNKDWRCVQRLAITE